MACGVLAACAGGSVLAATVDIELRPAVSVSAGEVSLGDVAYLRSDDLAALQQFMALPLGRAPKAGTATSLTRDSLARWVGARLSPVGTRVTWRGAPEVAVQSVAHELSGFLVEQTARASLTGWLKQRATRFSVETVVPPRDVSVPPGQVALRVRPLPAEDTVASRQRVWVDVSVDNESVRSIAVDFTVAAYAPAWVSPRGVPASTRLPKQALQREEVSITAPGFRASPPLEAAGELRTRRTIAPGSVVATGDVEAVPAVSRGEQVTLLAGDGALSLETRGEALQDGRVGQAVRVRAAGSASPVLAQVVSPGRLRVQP